MPYSSEIVNMIDAAILETALTDARFDSRQFAGLTQQAVFRMGDKVIILPATITTMGEMAQVTPDDNYNIQTYHRIVSNVYGELDASEQYGDNNNAQASRMECIMTVIGFTKKLNLTVDQIEALFVAGFPNMVPKAFVQSLQMNRITVQILSSNFNSYEIFNNEFRGESYFLKPESVMFQIRYRVESIFTKGCFQICDCPPVVS